MKNLLIPMAAVTGDLSDSEIRAILERYSAKGISQFLIYPRDGCEVEYLYDRRFEICGSFITHAEELGIDIRYTTSSTGRPAPARARSCARIPCSRRRLSSSATAHNPGRLPESYADILNPDAVDFFINSTHESY